MTRGIGMLVGALLMLAIFLLALGAGMSPSSVQVPVQLTVSSAADIPVGPVPAEDVVIGDVVIPAADASSHDEKSRPDVDDDDIEITPQSWNQSMASYETAYRNEATEVSHYLVWSPFRSEWAAQGFARRLTLATGVPVEVISEGPENYQVVFSYRDDGERQAMVAQIEDVTGLELE
ncbi:MAG: hypothetical protein ABFS24_00405 [Pseudomonadota bacterium]